MINERQYCKDGHHLFTWSGGTSDDDIPEDMPCVCGKFIYYKGDYVCVNKEFDNFGEMLDFIDTISLEEYMGDGCAEETE